MGRTAARRRVTHPASQGEPHEWKEPKTVTIKIVGDSLVVEPEVLTVIQSQTLILFQLQIHGLRFAATGAILVDPPFEGSFMPPWTQDPPQTATLLDLNNKFGKTDYRVMVVRDGGTPFPLGFQKTPQIENKPF